MNRIGLGLGLIALLAGCSVSPPPATQEQRASAPAQVVPAVVRIEHPEWARNAAIYELNTRQFTAQGTFDAARAHLPRLRDLGVDIVWLMPIHPIGEARRKGTLGSPYAVRDYLAVNPEFGTLEDFREFVAAAHELGLYVIIDWVANHTAWDNPMIEAHPEWYTRDERGEITHVPDTDWTDVADLDYTQPALREYMAQALEYWVREVGIDGYRCDVAGMVPGDFWSDVRRRLDAIRPVFMLAEWEDPALHIDAFDATYAWSWYDLMHRIAMGRADVRALSEYYADDARAWPEDSLRMTFVSNHDKNTWDGTQFEQFGAALEAAIVLSVVGDGMPLLYNGQEAGNRKRLEFFEKDAIVWRDDPLADFYRSLFGLLEDNRALWHGRQGGPMTLIANDAPRRVLSFVRRHAQEQVFAILNLSPEPAVLRFEGQHHHGDYRDHFTGRAASFDGQTELRLAPWAYRVYVR